MIPATIENVRARYESGLSVQRIANELRLKRSEVQRVINRYGTKRKATTAKAAVRDLQRRQESIAELIAEGYSAELVAANFGG